MDKAVIKNYWWIIGLVIVVWLTPLLLICCSPLQGFVERGQFGDMFGVINALFTGLAFAFVVISLFEQQKQLREQEKQMARRDFESVFFELLRMHNENVQGAVGKDPYGSIGEGVVAFSALWQAFLSESGVTGYLQRRGVVAPPASREDLGTCYVNFYVTRNRERVLGNYFRTLYQLMTYILRQESLLAEEKYRYAKIVRARMSNDELSMLFVNGLSEYGEASVEYIEAFSMFKHLDLDKLKIDNPKQYYKAQAFDHG